MDVGLGVCGLLLTREVSPAQLLSAGQDGLPSWVPPGSSGADGGLHGQQPTFQNSLPLPLFLSPCPPPPAFPSSLSLFPEVLPSILSPPPPPCVKPKAASFQALKGIQS